MDMDSIIPNQSVFSGLRQAGAQQSLRLLDIAQRVHHQENSIFRGRQARLGREPRNIV
jgi:hypothetical protein